MNYYYESSFTYQRCGGDETKWSGERGKPCLISYNFLPTQKCKLLANRYFLLVYCVLYYQYNSGHKNPLDILKCIISHVTRRRRKQNDIY